MKSCVLWSLVGALIVVAPSQLVLPSESETIEKADDELRQEIDKKGEELASAIDKIWEFLSEDKKGEDLHEKLKTLARRQGIDNAEFSDEEQAKNTLAELFEKSPKDLRIRTARS